MKKEELDGILKAAFYHLLKDINYKETRTRYEQAHNQIRALIKKEVTEEWIQEKTVELIEIISKGKILGAMSFIRKLVKEILE